MSHKINAITATTIITPTHTPALKMPPITSQEERKVRAINKLP
jgi:hypothetical protein